MVSYKSHVLVWFISAPKLWDSRPIGTSPASALITVADFHCGELASATSQLGNLLVNPKKLLNLKNPSVIFSKSTAKNLSGAQVRMAHRLLIFLPLFQNFPGIHTSHEVRCEKPPPGVNFRALLRWKASRGSFFLCWMNQRTASKNEQSQAAPLIALRPLIQEPYPPRLWKKHLLKISNLGILNHFEVTEKTSPTPSVN